MTQNGTISNDLSSKQTKFIDCLLVGTTLTIAAKTADISPRTAVRWKQDPGIIAVLQNRRKEQFNETLDAFRAGLPSAMDLVLETIKDKETPRSIRLRAAQIWIEHALEIHAVQEMEARLTALEERYQR